MYIVMVASECAPVAKAGGLGDVVFGLSRELEIRGNAVEIILPKYDCMRYDQIWGLQVTMQDLWVPWFNFHVHCTVWFGFVHGRKCFFIEPHSSDNFFNRGAYYGFADEHMRFAFFTKAALEYVFQSGKRPDVIHTHDWQTGLLPVLLYETYQHHGMERIRVCHTIHNFMHQGIAGENLLWFVGLGRPEYYFHTDRLGDDFNRSAINFTKGAIVYSNYVTTVSPHHAWEASHTEMGCGLGHTLWRFRLKFRGVLNGLDYEMWNPEIDPLIARNFTVDTFEDKAANKTALRQRLLLRDEHKPIVAYIGRLDRQKGMDMVRHGIFRSLEKGAQFVLLGSSTEQGINAAFWSIKNHYNDNPDLHLELGYNEELAHLIYAGADILIVPSLFEPCGLTQMIAMRYGTVPVVRAVGGLVNTVFDRDHSEEPEEKRNGYVFHQSDNLAVESALDRAIGLWFDYAEEFAKLAQNGMRADYSWNIPGGIYTDIYEYIRDKS